MTDQQSMEDFESLLDASMQRISNGDMVEGTILEIGPDAAIVDIGSYMDGILSEDELPEGQTLSDLKKGDKVRCAVLRVDTRESQIFLSKKNADRVIAWNSLASHHEEGDAVLVKVESAVKGGLRVSCGQAKGFMPASQIDTAYVDDLSAYVGRELKAQILDVDEELHEFTCSRKNVLKEEQRLAKEHLFSTLHPGDRISGTVQEIRPYGVFVEIENGVCGLVHISDLSWVRVKDPSEVVSVGQVVEVCVESVDPEKERISLSLKDAGSDPWDNVSLKAGDELTGCEVRRIISSGAFVKVGLQLEGFLPISQISDKRIRSVSDVLSEGSLISVRVLSVDPKGHRISLSMRDTQQPDDNPYDGISFYSTDDDGAGDSSSGGKDGSEGLSTSLGSALSGLMDQFTNP